MNNPKYGINIRDFILEKYTEAKTTEPSLEVIFENEPVPTSNHLHAQQRCIGLTYPFASSELSKVPIKYHTTLLEANKDVNYDKDIITINVDVEKIQQNVNWQPGDTIAILPSNSKKDVDELLISLDLYEKSNFKCLVRVNARNTKKTAKVPAHIPASSTAREILQDCLNLNSILKKQFLSCLANYCSDNNDKLFLKSLSSKEGSSFYNDLVMSRGYKLVDILKICPSCKPPLELLIEHLARLLPRPYSIANSPLENAQEIHIYFSILNQQPGVTTRMLSEKANEKLPSLLMYFREPNAFRYTDEDFTKNQIFIAIGTGLAPFLGFLQHKEQLLKQECLNQPGKSWLFVGATTAQAIICRQQLSNWQSSNILNKFVEAHSRSASSTNQYVQDALQSNSKDIVELLIQTNTVLYLCADGGQISKCIETTLANIVEKELDVTEEEALQMLKEFKVKGKYREDLWL